MREGALSNAAVAVVWVVWILVKGPAESEHPGVYTRVDLSGSDLMALAFFSVTIWCLISAARGESSVVAGIISGLALAAACFTRYAYYPLAVLLPFSYGALAWIRPIFRRQLLIAFALSAFLALLGVAATVGYEYLAAGRALVPNPLNHIQRGTPSWYWHHLGRMSPFPASALGFTSFADWLARKCPAWASILPSFAAWLVSLAILIVLCYGLRVGCMQRCSELMSAFDKRPATCVFILAGLATCLIVVGMVSYLSVHNPPELWFPGGWTYVMGSRYYAPLHPFIIVWVVLSIHSSSALCRVKGMATLERSDEKGVRPPKQEPCLLSFRTLLLSLVICCMALLASFTLRNWKVVKWITDYGYTRTGYNWLYRDLESVEVAVRSLRRNKAFVFLAMVDSKGPTRDPSEAEEAQAIFDNIADVLGWKVRLTGVVLTPARTLASLPYERIQGGCVLLVLGPERQYPFTDLPDVLRERKDVKPIARLTRGRVLYEWSAMPVRSD